MTATPDQLTTLLEALEDDMSPQAAASFAAIAADYLAGTRAGEGPVSTPLAAGEIAPRFDEPLPRAGQPLGQVVERVRRDVVADVNRLYHPMYVGHQVSAPLPAAVWSEVVIAALNQSVAVWEMSPTLTVLETQVVRWFTELAGLGPRAGGTLTSGGTEATFTALLAARSAAIPDVWTNGVGAEPPVVVCGEHAHYAVSRAVGAMGLGLRSLVTVPSRDHRMDVAALGSALAELDAAGRRVMAVVATAGSTATGSFDDLPAIADLCDARGIWLHVDGAHGASALLSPTRRALVRGLDRARSLAWDPHKMLLLPLSAGMVLVRDEAVLGGAFAQQAPYLFHAASGERSWDMGPRSFQCSRRGDVLKLWVALQRHGADGLGLLFDRLCDAARALHGLIAGRVDFEALHEPECNILCFRYIPPPGLDAPRLELLEQRLRERYNRSGAGWITATTLGGRRVLRVTIMNPRTSHQHLRALLDGLAAEGRAMAAELQAGAPDHP